MSKSSSYRWAAELAREAVVVVRFAVRAMIVVGAILSTGAVIAAVLTDPSGYISDRRAAREDGLPGPSRSHNMIRRLVGSLLLLSIILMARLTLKVVRWL